jgi:hypothetical protein
MPDANADGRNGIEPGAAPDPKRELAAALGAVDPGSAIVAVDESQTKIDRSSNASEIRPHIECRISVVDPPPAVGKFEAWILALGPRCPKDEKGTKKEGGTEVERLRHDDVSAKVATN